MQSHYSVAMNIALTALMHGRTHDDTVVSALPCPHVYGNVVMNSAFMTGMTLVMHPTFNEEAILESIWLHTRFREPSSLWKTFQRPAREKLCAESRMNSLRAKK